MSSVTTSASATDDSITGLEGIRAFLPLSANIATAGQPMPEQFSAIRAAGYEIVINLVPSMQASYMREEPRIVTELGMAYENICVDWERPTRADLARFFAIMDAYQGRKVFVHCAANKRVSAFIFLYRVLRLGIEEADAEDDLERIWMPVGVWREFLTEMLLCGEPIAAHGKR